MRKLNCVSDWPSGGQVVSDFSWQECCWTLQDQQLSVLVWPDSCWSWRVQEYSCHEKSLTTCSPDCQSLTQFSFLMWTLPVVQQRTHSSAATGTVSHFWLSPEKAKMITPGRGFDTCHCQMLCPLTPLLDKNHTERVTEVVIQCVPEDHPREGRMSSAV